MSDEIHQTKFPDELYGLEIEGIDLAILASDSMRLIDAYGKQGAELSDIQFKVLRQCEEELGVVIQELDGSAKKYFQHIHTGVKSVLKKIQHRGP